jgi:hypothetical protein
MPPASHSWSSLNPQARERLVVWVLCITAAVHVVIFSAAFPLFILDEVYHFDLVVKYSHLDFPRKQEYASEESMPYVVTFGTWEYMRTNDTLSAPPWKLPVAQVTPILLDRERRSHFINRESSQPPLYYLLEGTWWRLGNAIGFHDLLLVYLLRFFNAFIIMALVWLGWFAARLVFPDEAFIQLSVPALITFLPQTAFYSIGDDALSPLCFGTAFVCVLCWAHAKTPGFRLAAITGLALASVFLTKMSNLPLLAVAFAALGFNIFLKVRSNRLTGNWPSLMVLLGCALVPIAAWAAWCKVQYGDFIGSAGISQPLGWTIKPFSQWWAHPIFTPAGLWIFLSGNLATFWQDEKLWHGQRLSLASVNLVYTLVSILFLAVAACYLKRAEPLQRRALLFALVAVAAIFAFFGFSSIIYDFHNCVYPSPAFPYFTSGRLMLGALVPFLLLFTFGLDRALKKFGDIGKFFVLAVFLAFMLGSEIATDWPIFQSQYNWYHA